MSIVHACTVLIAHAFTMITIHACDYDHGTCMYYDHSIGMSNDHSAACTMIIIYAYPTDVIIIERGARFGGPQASQWRVPKKKTELMWNSVSILQ